MLESEHEAFDKILAELFASIDKPLGEAQRTAFWRGLNRMSLAEFSRCRDKILADLASGDLIDITDLSGAKGRASWQNGTILATDSTHSVAIRVAGGMPASAFAVTSDAHGGLLVHV